MAKKNDGTVTIHGREYTTVAKRVQDFREETGTDFSIITEIVENTENRVVMVARIYDKGQRMIATGHAEEFRAASQINRTSALENAETSAIGRALAALGRGGTEFASANEVQNAIHQQKTDPVSPEQRMTFDRLLKEEDPWEFWLFLQTLSDDARINLHDSFPRGEKVKMKAMYKALETEGANMFTRYMTDVKDLIDAGDSHGLRELWDEIGREGAQLVWAELDGEDRANAKELLQGEPRHAAAD